MFKENNIKMIALKLDFNFVIIIISHFTFYRNFCITRATRYLDEFNKTFFREIPIKCKIVAYKKKIENLLYLFDV